MRKNPKKFIPHNEFYCYGITDKGISEVCPFLKDITLDRHLQCFRNKKLKDNKYMLEDLSAKCSLDGKWIFDYIKHCNINEEDIKEE